MYLNACPTVPDDLLLAHELLHALGALPDGAPHPCPGDDGHPCDDPADALWPTATGSPLADLHLDAARDDYYGHGGSWPDLRDSVYLRRLGESSTTLAVRVRGLGTVTSSVPGVSCTTTCDSHWDVRMTVELHAAPARARRFVRWEGACEGRPCADELRGSRVGVTAVFAPRTVRLGLAVTGRGTLRTSTGWTCTDSCTRDVRSFSPVRIHARPAPGWRLHRWSGRCDGRATTCVVAMETVTRVRAVFLPIT